MIPVGHCAKTLNVLFWILKAIILNMYSYLYFERNIKKSTMIAQSLLASK